MNLLAASCEVSALAFGFFLRSKLRGIKPKVIKPTILAYIAGYVDGDGCFSLRKELSKRSKNDIRHSYSGYFSVASTDIAIMNFLNDLFRGSIETYDPKKHQNRKPQHKFKVYGKEAALIARRLLPYLVEKRKQAICFAESFETNDKTVKDRLVYEMKRLKYECDFVSKQDIEYLQSLKGTIGAKHFDFPYIADPSH